MAEPVGALIGYAVLFPFISPTLMSGLQAAVAGIMVTIALDELMPAAKAYGSEHTPLVGVIVGMVVMALSLGLMR